MVTIEFDKIVKKCGGLSGFAKAMKSYGFSTISHATISRWYKSNHVHPQEKYVPAVILVGASVGIKITKKDLSEKNE